MPVGELTLVKRRDPAARFRRGTASSKTNDANHLPSGSRMTVHVFSREYFGSGR